MAYRIAQSLGTLRAQVNAKWPDRSKISDGWVGDTSHSRRKSDHNPDRAGIVKALDITHDPAHGCHAGVIAEAVKADPRVRYIIWNRRIWNSSIRKTWRSYNGSNPHTKHVHISVLPSKSKYDSTDMWTLYGVSATVTSPPLVIRRERPLLRNGSKGPHVRELQTVLNKRGIKPALDADGDLGRLTRTNVIKFQRSKGLVPDGLVGAYTWQALLD